MAFVIVVVFINIQLIIDESLSQVFPQSNQRSVYKNEYVRKAAICVLVGIAQLVEDPAETDQLTFIKRHRAFESRKLHLVFYLFIYNSFLYFLYILLLFSFICLFYFL